jgi:hypothetical protein
MPSIPFSPSSAPPPSLAASGASTLIGATAWEHTHDHDRELAIIAFKPHAPVANTQAILIRSVQPLDIAR